MVSGSSDLRNAIREAKKANFALGYRTAIADTLKLLLDEQNRILARPRSIFGVSPPLSLVDFKAINEMADAKLAEWEKSQEAANDR